MYERTRFGTTLHFQKFVQDSDAYEVEVDGKIKRTSVRGSLRSQEVVCTLFFATCNGTQQGEGVPLFSLSRLFSMLKLVALAMCGMAAPLFPRRSAHFCATLRSPHEGSCGGISVRRFLAHGNR